MFQQELSQDSLDGDDLHSTEQTEMWLSDLDGQQPTWIQYEFDKAYKLHEMWVWNSNQLIEAFVGLGTKEVVIETCSSYSANSAWRTIVVSI